MPHYVPVHVMGIVILYVLVVLRVLGVLGLVCLRMRLVVEQASHGQISTPSSPIGTTMVSLLVVLIRIHGVWVLRKRARVWGTRRRRGVLVEDRSNTRGSAWAQEILT